MSPLPPPASPASPHPAGQAVGSFIAITGMGLVSVGLRTAQGLLHVAAGAGRLRALAPPTHGSGGPWWLPAGGQVWMNVISFFVTGEGEHDHHSWPIVC